MAPRVSAYSAWILAGAALVFAFAERRAMGEYGPTRRSINGTGETLPENEYEIGLTSLAYGVTSDTMVRVPTAAMLLGYGRVEARHKYGLDSGRRVSPYLGIETPRHIVAGADFGWDFGDHQSSSVTVGGRLRYGPFAELDSRHRAVRRRRALFLPNAEFDLYLNGNLVYAGMSDYLLYAGYTWAWESVHLGLVMSPASGIIPLPYIFWRF